MASAGRLPAVMRKWVGKKVTQTFSEAVELVTAEVPRPGPGEVLIKNRFIGINASDINYTAGRYFPGLKPPYDLGFEALGVIASSTSSSWAVGQPVGYSQFGAFAEYVVVPEKLVFPIPQLAPEILPLIVSGMTAAISLDKVGEIKKGETVMVTAAAGGTGQFAVQLAKQAGCHVIGTCSSEEKVQFLKKIGCDRPINYTKEKLAAVLRKEYPDGVNVIYESVGGDMFDTCAANLARHGRLIVIGAISGYESDSGVSTVNSRGLPMQLLFKSSSVRGFFMPHFQAVAMEYVAKLAQLLSEGKIVSEVDLGKFSPKGPFKGIESIAEAVKYLYSKKSIGKIVVELPDVTASRL